MPINNIADKKCYVSKEIMDTVADEIMKFIIDMWSRTGCPQTGDSQCYDLKKIRNANKLLSCVYRNLIRLFKVNATG
jgi:hypothetical protein